MRRIVLPILSLLAVACSSDIDEATLDEVNFDEVNVESIVSEKYGRTDFLTSEEKDLIDYFQYLTLWKGPSHNPKDHNRKWGEAMKLNLGGTISNSFRASVERVIAQTNPLLSSGDFNISLVADTSEANAHLFFGAEAEVEAVWPDMYAKIKDGNYDGYAITPSENNVLHGARIWLSNPLEALLKHELGHILGLGHSNQCEEGNSFLCSKISADNDILPIEKQVIRYLYHKDMPSGLSETEMETVLANLILNER